MKTVRIHIEVENDAFAGKEGGREVARILRGLADRYADAGTTDLPLQTLRDSNGNRVGEARLEEKRFVKFMPRIPAARA
jgi:hypothetical protein